MTMQFMAPPAEAAPSNQTLSFSARLKNSTGGVVADGYYNIGFRLYSVETAGTPVWTEIYHDSNGPTTGQDNRIKVANGYFSVKLGSLQQFTGVDWSGDLFLTMDIGGTAQVADTGSIAWDGEMTPRIQLSAMPYAMNTQRLGGKSADEFLQVGSGVQDLGNETSIAINKTGSGDLMQFQSSGTDVFTLSSTGSIEMGSTTDQKISIADSTSGSGQNLTLASGSATSGDSDGGDLVLQAGSGSGIGTDGTIVMGSDVTVGAGQTITMVGGATSLRPANPADGTLYFDTDTDQLLVYANGKWQGDRSTSTKIIAASNSTQANRDSADYLTDGVADEEQINAAIASLPTSGGLIYLSAGTYTVGAPITYSKQNVTIQGESENSTTIRRGFNTATNGGVINFSSANATLSHIAVDGNKAAYTSANNSGLYMSGHMVGGHSIEHVRVNNNAGSGLRTGAYAAYKSSVSYSQFSNSGENGIVTDNPEEMFITNNRIFGNAGSGIAGGSNAALNISDNDVYSNTGHGISARGIISNNTVRANGDTGILGTSNSGSSITSNLVVSNKRGIAIPNMSNDVIISGNRVQSSTQEGIFIDSGGGGSRGNITGNIIKDSGYSAIRFQSSASGSSISANQIYEYGGSGNYYGITVGGTGSDVAINGNTISDSVGTGLAIQIGSSSINTHLEGNVFYGDGANGILDSSASTTYSNQHDGNGKLINRSAGGFEVQTSSGSTGMAIDASTGDVAIAGTLDTTSATALNIGTTNATSINLGQDTTVDGSLTADSVQTANIDTATATDLVIGGTNATSVTMAADLAVGAGKTITMVGGATSLRPASPSEGTVYYDTDTKQLLVYADSKWQPLNGGGTSTATKVVAASNSPQAIKNTADYVADGTDDQIEINNAISSLSSSGGSIYLAEGVYNISGPVVIDRAGTSISGAGTGTVLKRMYNGVNNTDGVITLMTNEITISSLKIDGNKSTYTSTNNNGIASSSMRSNVNITGVAVVDGGGHGIVTLWNQLGGNGYGTNWLIDSNTVKNNAGTGISATRTGIQVVDNRVSGSGDNGISTGACSSTQAIVVANNRVSSNGNYGVSTSCAGVVISGNAVNANTYGVWLQSENATVDGNSLTDNATGIRMVNAFQSNVSSNMIKSGALGIHVQTSGGYSMKNNHFSGITGAAVSYIGVSNDGVISSNTFRDYGSVSNSAGLTVSGSRVAISDNSFIDDAGTGVAIDIVSTANGTHLSNNTFSGPGANGINDNGTGTTYSNQRDSAGKLINRSEGGFGVQTSTGSDAMTIDATTGDIAVAGTLEAGSIETAAVDTSAAGALAIGANNATSVTIGTSDTTGTLLVLDTKTNAGDPSGVNGAMYYNADASKFRCYQAGDWVDCVTPLPVSKVVNSAVNIGDTPSDVTGLSFSLAADTKYYYKFVIMNDSETSSNGIGFGITAPSDILTSNWCANTNTSLDSNETDQPGLGTYCGTDDVYTIIDGTITPSHSRVTNIEGYLETGSSAGDLQLRAQASLSTGQAIREGSFGILQIVQ